VLFALRRERDHLELIQAACNLKGLGAPCQAVVAEIVQTLDTQINLETDFKLDDVVLVNSFWFFRTLGVTLNFINNLPCKSERPCVRELLAPILALDKDSDVSTFRVAIEVAQQGLFGSSDESRHAGLDQLISIYKPLAECSFHKLGLFGAFRGRQLSCLQERRALAKLDEKFATLDPASWLTQNEVDLMKREAQVSSDCCCNIVV
jgi:hypothetical protein